jgi:hypothetical protein
MKVSALYKHLIMAVGAAAIVAFIAKLWNWLAAAQLRPDTLLLSVLMIVFAAVILIFVIRSDRSLKLRLDLLFRMGYQGPFLNDIRQDAEERALYSASIVRKLRDLAELNRAYRDDRLCSYYIGCLAFLANEKRANLPWNTFRDELAKHFAKEIISGKIARHAIDDHYKGMWADLVKAAERAGTRRKRESAADNGSGIVRVREAKLQGPR